MGRKLLGASVKSCVGTHSHLNIGDHLIVNFSRCDHRTSLFRLEYKESPGCYLIVYGDLGIFCVNYSVLVGDHASFIELWDVLASFPDEGSVRIRCS